MASVKPKGPIPTNVNMTLIASQLRHQGVCPSKRRDSLKHTQRQKSKNVKNFITENESISGCLYHRQGISKSGKDWSFQLEMPICCAHLILNV